MYLAAASAAPVRGERSRNRVARWLRSTGGTGRTSTSRQPAQAQQQNRMKTRLVSQPEAMVPVTW